MYFYLYDSFLQDKKYGRTLDRIEARVADLGIKGRVIKLTILQQIEESIKEAVDRGAKTVVVVGNDKTINRAVNILANFKNVTLGIVPIGEENSTAKILGIPFDEAACDVISNRLIDILDVGKINELFFLGRVELEGKGASLECDGIYKIEPAEINTGDKKEEKNIEKIIVANFGYYFGKMANPKDGALQIIIVPEAIKRKGFFSFVKKDEPKFDSIIANKYIKITSKLTDEKNGGIKEKPIRIDEIRTIKTPAQIQIAPRRLKVIVGKERLF